MVLPSGFELPPLPYLLVLFLGIGFVSAGLWWQRPRITEPFVLSIIPWMLVGAALSSLYQLDVVPPILAHFIGTPTVYGSVFVVGGTILIGLDLVVTEQRVHSVLGSLGILGFLIVTGILFLAAPTLRAGWSILGLVISVLVTLGAWWIFRRIVPGVIQTMPWVGVAIIFGHVLDGVSTAIGIDILGFSERTPASQFILDIAAEFPTADLLGVGWLFVIVKLVLASLIVWLFTDYVDESPTQAYLLLVVILAVGLGPGAHNLLLYAVR